ncbi:MAG: hypothetical protein IAE86_22835 [Burkholderiaceae bacterium]|nr:hypothetical protein [Burkholderiaceae bacterium]
MADEVAEEVAKEGRLLKSHHAALIQSPCCRHPRPERGIALAPHPEACDWRAARDRPF